MSAKYKVEYNKVKANGVENILQSLESQLESL